MNFLQAVVLGIVEGVTEYLPVSSTGHLIIAADLLGLKSPEQKSAVDTFNIVIQGGAILAVVGLYFPRFIQMLKGLLGKDPAGFKLLVNLGVAFLPAAVVGLLVHSYIKQHLFVPATVIAAFILGGVYMLIVEQWRRGRFGSRPMHTCDKSVDDMTIFDALKIGLLQILSMWPGTSRSMMTITGGYFAGLRPAAAAEFSFLLGAPTLLAATGLDLYKDLKDARINHTPTFYQELGPMPVIVGLVVAAISAAIAVKWLVSFLNRHGLSAFGIYRIVLGISLAGLIVGGIVKVQPPPKAPQAANPQAIAPAVPPAPVTSSPAAPASTPAPR